MSHGPHFIRSVLCDFGLTIYYYLLIQFAFHTLRYYDQGPEVRTELVRSMREDRSLNILQYEKKTWLRNNSLDVQEMREGPPSLKGFCDLGLKRETSWVTHRQDDVYRFLHP